MGKVIINPLNFAWTLIHRSYFSLLFRSSNKPDFYIDSTKWFFFPHLYRRHSPMIAEPRSLKRERTTRGGRRGRFISRCRFDGCDRDATPPTTSSRKGSGKHAYAQRPWEEKIGRRRKKAAPGKGKRVGKKEGTGESKEVAGLKGASLRKPGAGGLFYMVIFYPLRPR